MVQTQNPWNQVAWFETHLAQELFDRGQYANAANLLNTISDRVSDPDARKLLQWLKDTFDAFHAWDIFDHKKAGKLNQVVSNAEFVRQLPEHQIPNLHSFCKQAERSLPFLKSIKTGEASREMAQDLLANAKRRADLEGKYEDAVARCYSAIEKLAKVQLKEQHKINNSDAEIGQIPKSLQTNFKRYQNDETGRLQFGLKASFQLLEVLGDSMGKEYMQKETDFGRLLGMRNESILGHGFKSATLKNFNDFFGMALSLGGIEETDLVRFPHFQEPQ
jgi:CRISPR-associated protein (TIGR02710 family)